MEGWDLLACLLSSERKKERLGFSMGMAVSGLLSSNFFSQIPLPQWLALDGLAGVWERARSEVEFVGFSFLR